MDSIHAVILTIFDLAQFRKSKECVLAFLGAKLARKQV